MYFNGAFYHEKAFFITEVEVLVIGIRVVRCLQVDLDRP